MTILKQHGLLALLAVALGSTVSLPAAAQDRSEIREVLNRAETQAARRAVEDLLGSVTGIGRAEAQTAPPRATSVPTQPQAPQATTVPGAARSAIEAGGPNAVVPSAATGTPTQPTMIVRVPAAPETAAGPSTAQAPTVEAPSGAAPQAGALDGRAAVTPAPSAGPGRSEPTSAPAAAVAVAPRSGPQTTVAVRLTAGRMVAQDWCPPARR